jgi:ferritin-like metal-binding protein YciE
MNHDRIKISTHRDFDHELLRVMTLASAQGPEMKRTSTHKILSSTLEPRLNYKNMIRAKFEATLMEALIYELQQLYYSEMISESRYHDLVNKDCVDAQDNLLRKYLNGSITKIKRLEQVFGYLMAEPHRDPDDVITRLTEEAYPLLSIHRNLLLHEISTLGYIQVMNSYRVAGYRTAYAFAAQLQLDFVADAIQQLLEWELNTAQEISEAATEIMHLQSA